VTVLGVCDLAQSVGTAASCRAFSVSRATHYRSLISRIPTVITGTFKSHPRALSAGERENLLATLHSERFCDMSPTATYATLLDDGIYLASISTYYRVLHERGEVRERRSQATHPARIKPELCATAPNQIWSWDITKLLGPQKWVYFQLYVIIDIFSRYVVGWTLTERESGDIAKALIDHAVAEQRVDRHCLTLHADNGPAMISKPVCDLLSKLDVLKSHSRPHTSNDNPFSESQFKTMKYRPTFPERFANIEQARAFCRTFFPWYNHEHRHSGIALLTPADVHFGRAETILAQRAVTLNAAYVDHPERFVRKPPMPLSLDIASYINPPELTSANDKA
jgi:putative transposase